MGLLSVKRGARPATIVAVTDARLKKTGNPFGEVFKVARVNVMVNWQYTRAVNRQREREGSEPDFISDARSWGTRLAGLPFVTYEGRVYLECKVEKSLGHTYVTDEGEELAFDQVEPFLPKRHSNAEHQGVAKEIILRDYGIHTIQQISFDGATYAIDPKSIESALQAA